MRHPCAHPNWGWLTLLGKAFPDITRAFTSLPRLHLLDPAAPHLGCSEIIPLYYHSSYVPHPLQSPHHLCKQKLGQSSEEGILEIMLNGLGSIPPGF